MKIVTCQQMNLIDQLATSEYDIPSLLLMEHAAHEIFLSMQLELNNTDKICIVCGHGNNGGDGFALARFLHHKKYDVSIYFVGQQNKLTHDAQVNYTICKRLFIPFVQSFQQATILVDAIFGTGLTREISDEYKELIVSMNESNKSIYSIDIPSGIDSDSGKVIGCAIKATITFTLQCGKIGLYIQPGRSHAGKVKVLDIYIPHTLIDKHTHNNYVIDQNIIKQYLPKREGQSHKGTYGKVLCVGGSQSMSGAISLAAKSALASGCGMMTCAIPHCIQQVIQTNVLESMSIAFPEKDGLFASDSDIMLKDILHQYTTILFGCGIGKNVNIQQMAKVLWESSLPLLVDADGLYAVKEILTNRKNTILTPHIKEFAMLMGVDINTILQESLTYVDMFCKMYPSITLVLKSDTTIIAHDNKCYFNTFGNNGLAVGGSGDVLAGVITGLYAQCKNSLEASVCGVFLHACSADQLALTKSEYSIIPSDIVKQVEIVLKQLQEKEKQ